MILINGDTVLSVLRCDRLTPEVKEFTCSANCDHYQLGRKSPARLNIEEALKDKKTSAPSAFLTPQPQFHTTLSASEPSWSSRCYRTHSITGRRRSCSVIRFFLNPVRFLSRLFGRPIGRSSSFPRLQPRPSDLPKVPRSSLLWTGGSTFRPL